ncbi:MAG: tRNA uridine-5-carboxymethylaminomethyl(34) synthesis GTPase MnmE [Candidatus Latescibacteria bacterium]|nr:tRNA uridine-5-carboxymethylaminomethyl(34) synthesis GTPase MnmE [Candidatus Latescibacterota bacterium]
MRKESYTDTIAAIATARGPAGISIIRISGPRSISIADKLFRGKIKPSRAKSHTVHFGEICNPISQQVIDQVMLSVFLAPHTYTGDDMAEISCHGSDFVASQILKVIIKTGARLAEPGEFTKRRVLANKMDITQAEAVLALTNAKNESTCRSALDQLQGKLTGYVADLGNQLKTIIARIEHLLEFEESNQTTQLQFRKIINQVKTIRADIDKTIKQNEALKYLHSGVYCVIIGKPNVGKSSLFNRLLEQDRAIVTEIPGTTRDSLQETVSINNLIFHLIDTAGLKIIKNPDKTQKIEAIGIEKSQDWLKTADFILAVFDNSSPLTQQDRLVYDAVKHKPHLIVLNKIDRTPHFNKNFFKSEKTVLVSAKYNQGVDRLKNAMSRSYTRKIAGGNGYLALNERHLDILKQLSGLIKQAEKENYLETALVNLRNGLDLLGSVTSLVSNEQILDTIFSKFCIGK